MGRFPRSLSGGSPHRVFGLVTRAFVSGEVLAKRPQEPGNLCTLPPTPPSPWRCDLHGASAITALDHTGGRSCVSSLDRSFVSRCRS